MTSRLTSRTRRSVATLAASAFLLLSVGCSSDDSGGTEENLAPTPAATDVLAPPTE